MLRIFAVLVELIALRDVQIEQLKMGNLVKRIFDLPRNLTRPAPTITEGGQRRKIRFLRTALFTAVCVFPILQITSEPVVGHPLFSFLTIILAGVYILSGTANLRLASTITIICTACIPFLIILLFPVWTRGLLAMQILTWPVISVLIGSQLLPIKKQYLHVGGMTTALILLSIAHPGIIIGDVVELLAIYFAISVLLVFTSWTQDFYSTGLERSNKDLVARRRELEIYTSLLRHDLSNDVQMILGGIELSQMSRGEPKQVAFLESTLAAAERMKSLLHIFSMSEAELDTDVVTIIERIGKRAEIAFKGMLVSFNVSDEVRQQPPKYGRLIVLAVENLLRNSAQHAGNDPNVEIRISRFGDTLEVLFGDDGPGVDPSIRDNLFGKGVSTGPEGKGLGLYLTKAIIESENGSIELITTDHPGCCFLIKLPFD
jgi:signal transduction histidine kinase